jgi:hypothetical protein
MLTKPEYRGIVTIDFERLAAITPVQEMAQHPDRQGGGCNPPDLGDWI